VTNATEVERVRTALLDICEPMHEAFTWADTVRCKRMPELLDPVVYGWHATHTTRALAHHQLGRSELGVWSLSGNHARNGELWLTDGEYRVRILHALSDQQVPPPGLNAARRAYYRNPPLTLGLPMPLFGPINDRLLLLWRVDGKTHEPSFRVVRPVGDWKWGANAQTDLDFFLPSTATALKDLEFTPTDEGLELQIPGDEDGGQDAGERSG
jgi:hypothetical protein